MLDLLVGLGLAMVIEGILYALFPEGMKRAMALVMTQPASSLRTGGFVLIVIGFGLTWLIRSGV